MPINISHFTSHSPVKIIHSIPWSYYHLHYLLLRASLWGRFIVKLIISLAGKIKIFKGECYNTNTLIEHAINKIYFYHMNFMLHFIIEKYFNILRFLIIFTPSLISPSIHSSSIKRTTTVGIGINLSHKESYEENLPPTRKQLCHYFHLNILKSNNWATYISWDFFFFFFLLV